MPVNYTYQDIIDRAKIYVDDNSKAEPGWKKTLDWLAMLRPEIINCYRKWIQNGLISISWTDVQFTGPTYAWTDPDLQPLVIVGVVQNMGSYLRPVLPSQPQLGRAPFLTPGSSIYPATTWSASYGTITGQLGDETSDVSTAGVYQIRLHPPDTASNYIVRYIAEPAMPSDVQSPSAFQFYAPTGYEDYVALRLARKALASEGHSSQAIERLIMEAEKDMKMDSFSNPMNNGPKVRIVKPFNRQALGTNPWQVNPYLWFYF